MRPRPCGRLSFGLEAMRKLTISLLLVMLLSGLSDATEAQQSSRPSGPTILTVTGALSKANRGPTSPFDDAFFKFHEVRFDRAYAFDLAALEALGMKTVRVKYPSWPDRYEFEGPLLRDVLAAVGATGQTLRVFALDGYAADIPMIDILTYPIILALKRNGRYMGIGGRGPVWVIYPRDDHPALQSRDDRKWVWSAFLIEVK